MFRPAIMGVGTSGKAFARVAVGGKHPSVSRMLATLSSLHGCSWLKKQFEDVMVDLKILLGSQSVRSSCLLEFHGGEGIDGSFLLRCAGLLGCYNGNDIGECDKEVTALGSLRC